MALFRILEASLRPMGLAAVICAGSMVVGCSSDPEAAPEVTRGDFCEQWAEAACSSEVVSVCQASTATSCKAGQIDACLEKLPNGFIDRGVDDCIAAVKNAYEDADLTADELEVVERFGAPCNEIFLANDKGEDCVVDTDCESALSCIVKDQDEGTCQTAVVIEPGLSCSNTDETCTEGFYCDGNNCIGALNEDDDCENDRQCGSEMYCDNVCTTKTDVGDDCVNDSQCASGICYAAEGESTCVTRLRLSPAEPMCDSLK